MKEKTVHRANSIPALVRVGLYTRISTDEAHQPYSLGAQADRLHSYVKSQENWSILHTYEDQMTGTVLERPGLQEALAHARQGKFDLLLVFRVDRLARSIRSLAAILEELDRYGVAFRSATEPFDTSTPAGRMMVQMLGVFAEFERATLIERVVAGMERKASEGGWNGPRPFGYEYDSNDGCLKINPEEAQVVSRMFDLYAIQKLGSASIAHWLNDNGYRNRLGKLWRANAVRIILRNRVYVGEVPWKDKTYPGRHKPIIDERLFAETAELLKSRGEDASRRRSNRSEFLFSGLLECQDCDRPFAGTTANGNGGNYRYYTCRGRHEYGVGHCGQERVPADDLERDVTRHAIGTLRNKDLLQEAWKKYQVQIEQRKPQDRAELDGLEKQLSKLRGSIDKYLDAFESGEMPPDVCGPRLQELQSRLIAVEARRAAVETESQAESAVPDLDDIVQIGEGLAHMLETLRDEDLPKFKELIRMVVPKIQVESRSAIRPFIFLPLVRFMDTMVGADRFELPTPAL